MIFIDADKESYPEYFELSLKLSRPGTLIAADNVIRAGRVLDPQARASDPMVAGVARFADALANCPAAEGTILQWVGTNGHDGVALAIVKEQRLRLLRTCGKKQNSRRALGLTLLCALS